MITIRSNQRSTFFLSAVLLLLLDFHGVARVLAAEASLGRYIVVPIPRPIEDSGAILLPGKSENPVTETWSNIEGPQDAPWFTGTKFVRNVPQASITPFLPDPAKATGAAMIVAPGGGTVVLSMEREGYVPPDFIAVIYEGLGERDKALEWFEKAYAERSMNGWILPDPRLDPIRTEPRFKELIRRMGLPR